MTTPGIVVRYIYSACVVTSTPDVKILHDPWFSEGIYDGSWFHYPQVPDPIASIGDVDLVYVSHIHPDHYDSAFLRAYFKVYGQKEVIVADHTPNHLVGKMRGEGFKPTVLQGARARGRTTIEIIPHVTASSFDIDSAIIVRYDDGTRQHCVLNVNDIVFDDSMLDTVVSSAGAVDILLCGYTGAGPYPQTYFDIGDPRLVPAAERKRLSFFERYKRLTAAVGAKANIPFAGKYLLGGRLTPLNDYRGVADATEVLQFDPHAVVLADNGGEISTADLEPRGVRMEPYPIEDVRRREREIAGRKMDYERLISAEEIRQLPIKRLLAAAIRRACKESECDSDYYFVIQLPNDEVAVVNAKRSLEPTIRFAKRSDVLPEPRSEIEIDPRYLFGLLTNVYHWNNAEVGSQYHTRRTPDVFNNKAQLFLSFLRV